MLFNSFTIKGTECKFSNAYFRGKNLVGRSLCDMLINPASMVEVFNPSVSVKNITFHKTLIVKVNLTI